MEYGCLPKISWCGGDTDNTLTLGWINRGNTATAGMRVQSTASRATRQNSNQAGDTETSAKNNFSCNIEIQIYEWFPTQVLCPSAHIIKYKLKKDFNSSHNW